VAPAWIPDAVAARERGSDERPTPARVGAGRTAAARSIAEIDPIDRSASAMPAWHASPAGVRGAYPVRPGTEIRADQSYRCDIGGSRRDAVAMRLAYSAAGPQAIPPTRQA